MKKALGYVLGVVAGAVALFVQQKTGSVVAGSLAGGAVGTAGARLLHLQPPPGTPPKL